MNLTADTIISMLRASVAATYGETDALTIGTDSQSNAVVVCPPVSRRDLQVWAIAVQPGPAPVEIEVLGTLPLEDARFQHAIGDTLGAWVREPELLDSRELAVLAELRDESRASVRAAL